MITPRLVVDTSVVVEFFSGEQTITRMLEQCRPVFVPVVVIAELLTGARRSQRVAENVQQIAVFISRNHVLTCDLQTADHYSQIADELRLRGRPIPPNDMWIAAVARQHGLALASRDAHFDEVPSLLRIPC